MTLTGTEKPDEKNKTKHALNSANLNQRILQDYLCLTGKKIE